MRSVAEPQDDVSPEGAVLLLDRVRVAYRVRGRDREVLHSLSLRIGRGESYGLVGESGCGKSTAAFSVMRYLPANGRVTAGRIAIVGRDILNMPGAELRKVRSSTVSMVYQDPGKALNPSLKIGRQLREVFELRSQVGKSAIDGALEMLAKVQISDPRSVMEQYPHQLSGGMQQRICIAMALAAEPALLILDEPTTGLDATVEAEVLDLIARLREEFSTAVLFISHNLAVVSRMCDRIGILYAGTLAEEGPSREVFRSPRHPYTASLLRCLPKRGQRKDQGRLETIQGFLPVPGAEIAGCAFSDRCKLADSRCSKESPPLHNIGGHLTRCHYHERVGEVSAVNPEIDATVPRHETGAPLLRARKVSKTYPGHDKGLRVLTDISVDLRPGETLGLVGESGSGKSTFAKVLLGLTPRDRDGEIELDTEPLPARLHQRSPEQVRALQIVFQNPDSALNRSHSVRRIIGRALTRLTGASKSAQRQRMAELMESVRLASRYADFKPRQLSGGLKQRVAIARAFAGEPRIVVCDEPTSALDVSVQAVILNLLVELQRQRCAAYIFISHDLHVVRYISDRIAVLYLGRIMEIGAAEEVFSGPHHPYTEALLSAVPSLEREESARIRLAGEMPSAANPPSGCVFHTRCHRKIGAICERVAPPQVQLSKFHSVCCHLPPDQLGTMQDVEQHDETQIARGLQQSSRS